MALQRFLNSEFKTVPITLEALKTRFGKEFGVNVRQDTEDTTLFQFKYQGIFSKWQSDVTCECRGVILRATPSEARVCSAIPSEARGCSAIPLPNQHYYWTYCSRPWDKFFNLNGKHCPVTKAMLKEDHWLLYEKVDGTGIHVWFDTARSQWQASTFGTIRPGPVRGNPDKNMTYGKLFWKVLATKHSKSTTLVQAKEAFATHLDTAYTYLFEVATPYNQVVTQYAASRVVLLGVRHTTTGAYQPLPNLPHVEVPYRVELQQAVPKKQHRHANALYVWLESYLDSRREEDIGKYPEGLVLLHGKHNTPMAKLKSERYLELHGVLTSASVTTKAKMIARSTLADKVDDEYGTLPPAWQTFVDRFIVWFPTCWKAVHSFATELKAELVWFLDAKEKQKQYALLVLNKHKISGWSSFFFRHRDLICAGTMTLTAFKAWLSAELCKTKLTPITKAIVAMYQAN